MVQFHDATVSPQRQQDVTEAVWSPVMSLCWAAAALSQSRDPVDRQPRVPIVSSCVWADVKKHRGQQSARSVYLTHHLTARSKDESNHWRASFPGARKAEIPSSELQNVSVVSVGIKADSIFMKSLFRKSLKPDFSSTHTERGSVRSLNAPFSH